MTSPADTIREALAWMPREPLRNEALAALAELEQQLADARSLAYERKRRMEAAEADRDRLQQRERDLEAYYEEHTAEIDRLAALALERADALFAAQDENKRLADTLREIRVEAGYSTDGEDPIIARIRSLARAALDRHTKAEA